MTEAELALQALEEVLPPHLRSNRHGPSYLGDRYEYLKRFIENRMASPGTYAGRQQETVPVVRDEDERPPTSTG